MDENIGKPYRTILMAPCVCSKWDTEQRYIKNVNKEIDIRQCLECDAFIEWPAYIIVSHYNSEPGL